jgi:cytochrome oxidase Cu insertion factor (SCO1/SenC/PrrC family)
MTQPAVDPKQRGKNRRVVSGLVLLFAAPVILAYIAHYMGWFNVATQNNGTLLKAPYPHFEKFEWATADDEKLHFKDFETKWWWVYLPESDECLQTCDTTIKWLTRNHLALGKEADKLKRLVVFPSQVIYQDKVEQADKIILAKGKAQGDGTQLERGKVYLMDPHGNLFMQYEPVNNQDEAIATSKGIRDDVRKAMKITGL